MTKLVFEKQILVGNTHYSQLFSRKKKIRKTKLSIQETKEKLYLEIIGMKNKEKKTLVDQ